LRVKRFSSVLLLVAIAGCSKKDAAATTPAPVATEAPAPLHAPGPPEPASPPEPPPPEPEPPSPPPPAVATTPCDEYFTVIAEMELDCVGKIPPAAMDAMRQGRDAMRSAFKDWDKMDPASRQAATDAAAQGCLAARDAIQDVRVTLGCAR
jgi:hypothetical protein